MEEHIVIGGEEWIVVVMERLYISSEGFGPMRHAFLVDEESHRITIQEKNKFANLAAAIEDILSAKFNHPVPVIG